MPRIGLAARPLARARRVAMVSMHTSPIEQPGTGDAGGMNVYVDAVARSLARRGSEVEVFTRATDPQQPPTVEVAPGYLVHHLAAGPYRGLGKADLPGQLCSFTAALMRHEVRRPAGAFDVLHTHYWLSGQVGWVAANRWDIPWVHSMHTLARVKNALRAHDEPAEPAARILGEDQIVGAADMLIANTDAEASDLVSGYDADPQAVRVVHPGVDLSTFVPGDQARARQALGLPPDKVVLLFVGRLQPLKAPDVLLRVVAELVARDPAVGLRLEVVICGGPSGTAALHPTQLRQLAIDLGIGNLVRFVPPVSHSELTQWYCAADLTVVPSFSESFGLVAVESQAVGTPVVAAAVGGLRTAVADGVSGVLVDGHSPVEWAGVLAGLIADEAARTAMSPAAVRHARSFSWDRTARRLEAAYAAVAAEPILAAG